MQKIRTRNGFTITEMLMAVMIAAIVIVVCEFGIISAMHTIQTVMIKSTADALAQAEAQYIKNEIRFARSTEAVIEALSKHEASLNGLSVNELAFETAPNGTVIFRFTVAEYEYVYATTPLNRYYNSKSSL